jgi:hypothetical protein
MIEYLRADDSELKIVHPTVHYITGVTFEIYDLDTDEFVQSGTAALTASANNPSSSMGWTATLTSDSAAYDRRVKIEWIQTTASSASAIFEYATLIRPFATASRIRTLADIENTTTDATLVKNERKARYFLQAHTGTDFTKEYKSLVVYGNNSDILSLPTPLIRLDKIYEDDILIYDMVSTASVNEFDFNLETSLSRTRIKIINTEDEFERAVQEFPEVHVLPYDGVFKKDCQYKITGIWGYQYVPNEIEQATALLVEDYLCNDFNIRNKNISKLSNDSYDLTYASNAGTGTGNLLVDKLISPWLSAPRFMVI